nr:transposase [Streptomyces griseorubiginosus]
MKSVEGVWSLLRRGGLPTTTLTNDEHLERTLRRGMRHIQIRPDLIDDCLTGTGLTLTRRRNNPKSSVGPGPAASRRG